MHLRIALSVGVLTGLSFAGGVPEVCLTAVGSCCDSHIRPGCDDEGTGCCATVCGCDPFCCTTEWDVACATEGFEGNGCGAELLCAECLDTDGDGIHDPFDVCCNTAEGITVDEEGRPLGDLTGDCTVDLSDFAILQGNLTLMPDQPCPISCVGVECDDGDLCTIDDACDPATGDCVSTPVDCDDTDPCTTDTCDTDTGECSSVAMECPAGQSCVNGNCEDIGCTVDADCDDGFSCTVDSCTLSTGLCSFAPLDVRCDDGQFCTGTGTCDPGNVDAEAGSGCVRTGDPCSGVTPNCNEGTNACDACLVAADCDDGFSCTNDTCELTGACTNAAVDPNCGDPLFCDGIDTCDPTDPDADANGCVAPGTPCVGATPVCDEATDSCSACASNADCDDGFSCTDDTCDGGTGVCTNTPAAANCGDPLFCDGVDACDPTDPDADAAGCIGPGDPCAGATPICDEVNDVCNACTANADCDDGIGCTDDTCNGTTGACANIDNCAGLLVCNLVTDVCE